MEGLTLQIYNWLTDIEEHETADFLIDCTIDNTYVDTYFELSSDLCHDMYDVIVFVPPKIYKSIDSYKSFIDKIEEAIADNAKGDGILLRGVHWKPKIKSNDDIEIDKKSEDIIENLNEDYVKKKIIQMKNSIKSNPHVAIGFSKELIEICCKGIMIKKGAEFSKDWNLMQLVKETNKNMNFVPFMTDDNEKVKTATIKIISGFSNIVQSISELRNQFGSGHGHNPTFQELDKIYAKLAVSASSEFARFYLDILKLEESMRNK